MKVQKGLKLFLKIFIVSCFIIGTVANAKNKVTEPTVAWERTFVEHGYSFATAITKSGNNSFIVVGGKYTKNTKSVDILVIKIDNNGNIIWEKTFGSENYEQAYAIEKTNDGGCIIIGSVDTKYKEENSDGATSINIGRENKDIWVIKLDKNGNKIWDKTFGGREYEYGFGITKTVDNKFIIIGETESFGNGKYDAWIIKIDENGNKIWDKTFGGSRIDRANSIVRTFDDKFVVAGTTMSFGNGLYDAWIFKLDSKGNMIWERTFGGNMYDKVFSITQSKSGELVLAGYKELQKAHRYLSDMWIFAINKNGEDVWEKNFGGNEDYIGDAIISTDDGGFTILGKLGKSGAFDTGSFSTLIMRLDKYGNKIWEKDFKKSGINEAKAIIKTDDNGYIIVGNKDVKNEGGTAAWIFKLK